MKTTFLITAVGLIAAATVLAGCAGRPSPTKSLDQSPLGPQPGVVYYIDDHLGSSHLMTDSHGAVLREESRYPFGAERQVNGEGSDYVYTGKEYDVETGLIYFGQRYYAPTIGRWTTPDPLFLEREITKALYSPRELNLYSYAINNPMSYIDHIGEDVLSVAVNFAEWIAEKPFESSPSRYGKMLEVGVAIEIKNVTWKDLFKPDNYDATIYATKGFAAEQYSGASGVDVGVGINVSYLAQGARFEDFQGSATEHVGAVFLYGMSEIDTETGKHGWSFSKTAGVGVGTFTYETETKENIGSFSEFFNYYRGSDPSVE